MIGDSEDDILIGGVYADAGFRDAVGAVMAEWTSANTYEDRVNFIRGGGGANGPYLLVGHDSAEAAGFQNVFDDFAVDKLTGDAGRDWFFANVDGTAIDKITDLTSNEFTDADREFVWAP